MKDVLPVKDNLIGRIVGFEIPHQPAPVHIKPGREPRLKRTVWARVRQHNPRFQTIRVGCIATGDDFFIPADMIHTVMPETY
jgi:hypothetical protein